MEQRYLPLTFTAGNGTLTASVPANVHTAVPGVYMLFIVDSAGVPSVAKMVSRRLRLRPATAAPATAASRISSDRLAHVAREQRQVHLPGQDVAGGDRGDRRHGDSR